MERLTNTGAKGEIWITDNDETRRIGRKEAAYKKLAAYEDLGYTPEELKLCLSRDGKPKQTNADWIRSMTDDELAELITGSLNFDCADYCDSFASGCAFKCGKKEREIALKWLQSEAK